jgi:hypothetical protein
LIKSGKDGFKIDDYQDKHDKKYSRSYEVFYNMRKFHINNPAPSRHKGK